MSTTMPQTPPGVREAVDRYLTEREELAERAFAGADSLELAEELSERTDALILDVWQAAAAPQLQAATTLLALGSYGRRELAFGSDIDIMIELGDADFLERAELHDAVECFLTWSREAKLRLGHSVRTPEQTRREFRADPRTPISLLDARALEGQPEPDWQTVRSDEAAAHLRADDHGVGFVELLMQGYEARLERNGKTVYLLEPDIKSGEGGLRDLNCLHWAGRVRWGFRSARDARPEVGWTEAFRDTYRDGLRWLLRLRHLLHLHHGREHDRLSFRDQEKIAAHVLGGEEPTVSELRSKAERLMRHHYRKARDISMLTQRLLRRWTLVEGAPRTEVGSLFCLTSGQLALSNPQRTQWLEPMQVMEALRKASDHDALLDPVLEVNIAQSVASWGEPERQNAALNAEFHRLLTDPDISARTSERLLENGILTALIPEFEPIVCHVQHDVYHVYTTDIHSLKCLERARELVSGRFEDPDHRWSLFASVARDLERADILLLAALFHDIGKNRGGDHSRRGAEMMGDIGRRLGMDSADIDQLAFLVREHLTLSDTARRRDLSDPRVAREIASRLRTIETLDQLTALTFCDMSTVGPNVMTDWNATLIGQLYDRLSYALEDGLESLWKDRKRVVEIHRNAIWRLLGTGAHDASDGELRNQLDAFVRDVPTDHFAATEPAELHRQFEAYREALHDDSPAIHFTIMPDSGTTEIVVCARDVPGTLAKIAGVISASGLNIMAAQIVTTASGRTLDIFQVSQAPPRASLVAGSQPRPPDDPRRLERLADKLTSVLDGEISVESLLKKRISEARLSPRPTPPVNTLVDARQDISDAFTVFEVRAGDRLGLLYEIARTLYEHGVSTHVSKIDSLGTQIIDTFYVEELDGSKLSETRIGEVSNALYGALKNPPLMDEDE